MQFSEFRLDVVPAFKYDGDYYSIPDSVRQVWVDTDPFTFAERITTVNTNMGGTFVPLIKMVKAWNRNVGWPIRSFHLNACYIITTKPTLRATHIGLPCRLFRSIAWLPSNAML
jgi:hypothetical protein